MSQRDTIYKLFNMQPGEGRTVLLFMTYSLFMGMSVAVFYTCTTSLFLTTFDRSELPLAFIAGGILIYGLGGIVRALQRRLSFVQMNNSLLLFLLISVGCLLLAPDRMENKWLYFVLFLWNRVFVFVNGITFWATASRIFNLQQAKRLFSFISMGDVISSVLSYFSVPILLSFISTEQLLVAALAALLVCVGLMLVINSRFHRQLSAEPAPRSGPTDSTQSESSVHRRYYVLLYILALMPVFGLVYVEFMFTVQLKQVFPNKEILASFLGIFFGMCSIIETVIKAFLYNRLISAYSIRIGIVMLPLALLFSYTLTAVYGTIFGATSLLLAFIALSRFFMSSIRRSISEPVFQLLFQPIPATERTRLQSRIEGVPKALGNVVAGALLIGLYALDLGGMVDLSYVFLIVVIFWVGVSFQIQAEYHTILNDVVVRSSAYARRIMAAIKPDDGVPPVLPVLPAARPFDEIVERVGSPLPADRRQAATELGHSSRYYAYVHLLTLLRDDDTSVRKAAILAAGALGKRELWPRLFEHLAIPECEPMATAALIHIGEPVVPALARFFNQNDQSKAMQMRILQIVNDIGGETALRFLRNRINHPSQVVRDKVFEGLRRLKHRATVTERPYLLVQLDEQIALLVWLAAARLDLTGYAKQSALIRAIRREKQLIVPKVFNLLATLCGDDRFDLISDLITQKNDEIKGYLIELLGTALPPELKDRILPLFADAPLDEKLRRCSVNYPQQRLSVEDRIRDIINKDFDKLTPWVKAVAIRELLNWHQTDPTAILIANAASPDELIAETAFYVLKKLNPSRFAELHKALCLHLDPDQCRIANHVADGIDEEALRIQKEDALVY
ncbi:HEAT repeat domain-containing protein [Spirosoma koreense]